MHDGFLTPDYPLMLARMVPHGQLYVMDHASHHLQEERPLEYYRVVDRLPRHGPRPRETKLIVLGVRRRPRGRLPPAAAARADPHDGHVGGHEGLRCKLR